MYPLSRLARLAGTTGLGEPAGYKGRALETLTGVVVLLRKREEGRPVIR